MISRKLSLRLCSTAVCLVLAGAAHSTTERPKIAPQKFDYSARTIKQVERDGRFWIRKGDLKLYGTQQKPARIKTPSLTLSAPLIFLGAEHQNAIATRNISQAVKISGEIVPSYGGLPMRFEATCDLAVFDNKKQVWQLEGDVKGFYEDAHGRKSLNAETVTISRLQASVSVVQMLEDNVGGNTVKSKNAPYISR